MNYTSDQLQDIVLLNHSFSNDVDVKKIIDDLVFLQKKLEPMGVIKSIRVDSLHHLDLKTLVLLHKWQSDLFAMKHFKECNINPPSQNIFGIYV
jgi:hypothetical protein